MFAYLFENGRVHRCEYPSYMHLMAQLDKRHLNKMLYYPNDNAYIVRILTDQPTTHPPQTMIMYPSDPNFTPCSDIKFYETAFAWLQEHTILVQDIAYLPLATHGQGPCVLLPQPDSGSNWNATEYREWADNSMDVFTRFLCWRDSGMTAPDNTKRHNNDNT